MGIEYKNKFKEFKFICQLVHKQDLKFTNGFVRIHSSKGTNIDFCVWVKAIGHEFWVCG